MMARGAAQIGPPLQERLAIRRATDRVLCYPRRVRSGITGSGDGSHERDDHGRESGERGGKNRPGRGVDLRAGPGLAPGWAACASGRVDARAGGRPPGADGPLVLLADGVVALLRARRPLDDDAGPVVAEAGRPREIEAPDDRGRGRGPGPGPALAARGAGEDQ